MKRLLFLTIAICFGPSIAAQIFHQVTHGSGTQTIAGSNVTVNAYGGTSMNGSFTNCGIHPYGVGHVANNPGIFTFAFSKPATRVRLHFAAMTHGEKYYLRVNGNQLGVSSTNVSPYTTSTCTGSYPVPVIISDTIVCDYPSNWTVECVHQLDILHTTPIDSISITGPPATGGGGRVFDFFFSYDTTAYITHPYNDTVYCQGDSLFLPYTLSSAFAPGNVFSLQLSDASGSFASPAVIGTKTTSVAGTIGGKLPAAITAGSGYRVRLVSSNPVRISKDNETNIRIKPVPVPTAGSNSPLCAGSTLNLSAIALSGSGYSWAGPNSYSNNTQTPAISNAQTGHGGDYIVTATLNGCIGKDTVSALVKPMPATPTATNNGPLCPGDSLGLSSASTTAGVGYSWSGPASFSSSQQNPSILNVNSGHGGAYSVTTTLNGCSTSAQTTVLVKPMPAVPSAGSNSPVCAGGALNLTANSATGGVTYNWSGPNSFSSGTQNPVISPAGVNAAGTYNVTATLNGCTSAAGSTAVVINNVSSIGAYPSPNDTLCQMSPAATLVAVPFNGGSSPQLQWFKNGNPISGATALSYSATSIADGDTFYCRMTATGICTDPLVLFSPKIGITVLPPAAPPAIAITANPSTPLSPWQTVMFTATPSGNAGTLPTYQWKRNGSNILGATSNTWSANNLSDNDEISCEISSSEWCANPAKVESNKIAVHIKTGINDISSGRYKVYPNPATNELTIEGEAGMQVSILNVLGQEMYSGILNSSRETVNTSALIPGSYVVLLTAADGSMQQTRIVKQ